MTQDRDYLCVELDMKQFVTESNCIDITNLALFSFIFSDDENVSAPYIYDTLRDNWFKDSAICVKLLLANVDVDVDVDVPSMDSSFDIISYLSLIGLKKKNNDAHLLKELMDKEEYRSLVVRPVLEDCEKINCVNCQFLGFIDKFKKKDRVITAYCSSCQLKTKSVLTKKDRFKLMSGLNLSDEAVMDQRLKDLRKKIIIPETKIMGMMIHSNPCDQSNCELYVIVIKEKGQNLSKVLLKNFEDTCNVQEKLVCQAGLEEFLLFSK